MSCWFGVDMGYLKVLSLSVILAHWLESFDTVREIYVGWDCSDLRFVGVGLLRGI